MSGAEAFLVACGIVLTIGILGWAFEAAHDYRQAMGARRRHPSGIRVIVDGRELPVCADCGAAVYDPRAHAGYCAARDVIQ